MCAKCDEFEDRPHLKAALERHAHPEKTAHPFPVFLEAEDSCGVRRDVRGIAPAEPGNKIAEANRQKLLAMQFRP